MCTFIKQIYLKKAVMKPNETPMFFITFAVLWQTSKPYCDAHTSETAEISGDKPVWWT